MTNYMDFVDVQLKPAHQQLSLRPTMDHDGVGSSGKDGKGREGPRIWQSGVWEWIVNGQDTRPPQSCGKRSPPRVGVLEVNQVAALVCEYTGEF